MNSESISAASGSFINGRYLVRRGSVWIDPVVETMPRARRERVLFGSREYFQLLIRYPQLLFLSGTRQMHLLLGDTIYEISQ
jgi:hypothetical protein